MMKMKMRLWLEDRSLRFVFLQPRRVVTDEADNLGNN